MREGWEDQIRAHKTTSTVTFNSQHTRLSRSSSDVLELHDLQRHGSSASTLLEESTGQNLLTSRSSTGCAILRFLEPTWLYRLIAKLLYLLDFLATSTTSGTAQISGFVLRSVSEIQTLLPGAILISLPSRAVAVDSLRAIRTIPGVYRGYARISTAAFEGPTKARDLPVDHVSEAPKSTGGIPRPCLCP